VTYLLNTCHHRDELPLSIKPWHHVVSVAVAVLRLSPGLMDIFKTAVHADYDPSDGEPKSVSHNEHIANGKKQLYPHSRTKAHNSTPLLSR
jgi:hypothetical protein